MKRLMAIVLCLCCLLGLAACGAQSGDSGNDKKLVIWHDKEEAVVAAMQDYLREAVPDLEIVFEKKTSPTQRRICLYLPTIKLACLRRWGFLPRSRPCCRRAAQRIFSP